MEISLLMGILALVIVGVFFISRFVLGVKLKQMISENEQQCVFLTAQKSDLERQLQQTQARLMQETQRFQELNVAFVQQKTAFTEQKKNLEDKLAFLQESEQRLSDQFQKLAHQIFNTKQQEMNVSAQNNLNFVLNPFREQLSDFKKQIQDNYQSENNERLSLKHQIANLQNLNQNLAQEAVNLTNALKGSNKNQGDWGEMILTRLLENSGLTEGNEFKTQESFALESQRQMRPDVIVYLPQNRQIIVDSKVSLIAYERYFNAEQAAEQKIALEDHLKSIKKHVDDLSKKSYQKHADIQTLDYVLMFMPIENALQIAMQYEPNLLKWAADKNVLLVTPTSLMVTLRTIHLLWQQDNKNKNAEEIAQKAADLYDKFVGFVEDLEKLGTNLKQAQDHYQKSMNKLTQGSGNLVKRVDDFKKMGIAPKKSLQNNKNAMIKMALTHDEVTETESTWH